MKAKSVLFLLLLTSIVGVLPAQDMITYTDGTELQVKVTEVTSTELKFKKTKNPDGPLYTVLKSDLFMVQYENGDKEVFNALREPEEIPTQEWLEDVHVHYGGPRVGMTFVGEGLIASSIKPSGGEVFISQFGWQFETRLFTLNNGVSGLFELIPLVGGLDKGMFLPSASMLFGIRTEKNGLEFGMGPSVSRSGFGMILALGGSVKSENVYFPINLAFMPSYEKEITHPATGETMVLPTGIRISLLVGFNTRNK